MPDMQTALKSALNRNLSQVLSDWDDDGEEGPPPPAIQPVSTSVSAPSQTNQTNQTTPMKTRTFAPRNNVSRITFNYVRDNPGSTRKEIMIALEHLGFIDKSVSALLSQMVQNKMVHVTKDLYYADITEYTPIKSGKSLKIAQAKAARKAAAEQRKAEKAAAKKSAVGVTGIGALLKDKLEAAPERVEIPANVPVQRAAVTTIVRAQQPDDIIKNLTVFQARELYDRLKQIFGG